MALRPYRDEELNHFKFSSLALNEFPKALRQTFKTMWDSTIGHRPGFQLWDDSPAVRALFVAAEGGTTKVPTHQSYNEWDCTALFQATIFAQAFAIGGVKLSDLYLKPRGVPHGSFHATVVSPVGDNAETVALAIDQLRLLRNSLCHSASSEMDKITFDQRVKHAKDAFNALGVTTASIDVIGSLTESDFPINEVRKLELRIKEEIRAYVKFLEDVFSNIDELKALSIGIRRMMESDCANKDDISMLKHKLEDLIKAQTQRDETKNSGLIPSLLKSCLPSIVPHFTGRRNEREAIVAHVTSESTQLVSIWGSPGFGKTSVAIAVGHDLQSQGLPVYFLSLRGLQKKTDLTSKLLSFFGQPTETNQQPVKRLSLKDEVCRLFANISVDCVFILDNIDDLLQSDLPNVKEDVLQLLEEIVRRNGKVKLIVTSRESFEFMNLHFQGHRAVRIRPLDNASSRRLVKTLVPTASASDCTQITQICGHVPLAIKMLCSMISEDGAQPSEVLAEFMESTENIVEMLDNPDYPTNYRLQFLFDSFFQRLSLQEKEALVSLCILPESFNKEVAAAVLGVTTPFHAKRMLESLRRKSLLDSSSQPGSFSMHKLLQSFAREKGERHMKATALNSKLRLNRFYVTHFKNLNEQFLSGHSMPAFIEFHEDKQSIVQSLIDCCSDRKSADTVFDVLVTAEFFLATLFLLEEDEFHKIYDQAIKAAIELKATEFYRRLLVSKAFFDVSRGSMGSTMPLLSNVKKIQASTPAFSTLKSEQEKGKTLCYSGLCQLADTKVKSGIQCLQDALLLFDDSPEHTVLKIVILQILVAYYQFEKDETNSTFFYEKMNEERNAAADGQLPIIIPLQNKGQKIDNEKAVGETRSILNQPLKATVLFLVITAAWKFFDSGTKQHVGKSVLQMLKEFETNNNISLGLFSFYRTLAHLDASVNKFGEAVIKRHQKRISYHQTAIAECRERSSDPDNQESSLGLAQLHQSALAKCYIDLAQFYCYADEKRIPESLEAKTRALDITVELFGEEHANTASNYHSLGVTQHQLGDNTSALHSHERALEIRKKVFGEEHASTADSYHSLGVTQHKLGNYTSALHSHERGLQIRKKVFGEEHASTADSYQIVGLTENDLGDHTPALHSHKHALEIRKKVFGEEHASTADSYQIVGLTENHLRNHTSALHSHEHVLEIRKKVFGEEHASTADGYHNLGVTQHMLGDYTSALHSHERGLEIRKKVFGEEHASTADSYHSLGLTQHKLGDYTAAIHSRKRALEIRKKVFGEEHASTADSYHSLGVTQGWLGDYTSALRSHKRGLEIRKKVFGEEHASTADSYQIAGLTENDLSDHTSALHLHKHALEIRKKVFGEEHASTADCYQIVGLTENNLDDHTSALHSHKRALEIRKKVFGEEHASTADSYHGLGVTQNKLGDHTSALHSHERGLEIRKKVFGEEHASTADSYQIVGLTENHLRDHTSALHSHERALEIRKKVFGEEHASTADSYHNLGVTQHKLGDHTSALHSHERGLEIRKKVFGEEHASIADSYHCLGVTQRKSGDNSSALHSHERSLEIRKKVFGEEHASTADSYHCLGVTQHKLGDHTSALHSHERGLEIRKKVFGEEHASTADSYHLLEVIQHKLGDHTSALHSHKRALEIRKKVFGEEHARE